MSELSDAIREHLDLKRQRGADPAEVAREEQEALAPVTRSHPIVVAPAVEVVRARELDEDDALALHVAGDPEPDVDADEVDDHATQEFRVERGGTWLVEDD